MRLILIAAAAGTIALAAGCKKPDEGKGSQSAAPASTPPASAQPPKAEAPGAFAHASGIDAFGYYMPTDDVTAGALKLNHLHIGAEEDLKAWETGGRQSTYAPIMLQFDDVTSPRQATELGEAFAVQVRVLPDRYNLTPDGLTFTGDADRLGEVSFEGRFDKAALAAAKRAEPDSDGVVLSGRLKIGNRPPAPVEFTWFGGD